jgi:predicted transcriptional regulator of viral defense system
VQTTETEGLAVVAHRAPQAVFCLFTALQLHELTTQLPRQVWIAMPRGCHTPQISFPPIKMVQYGPSAYAEGIEELERDHTTLRVYSVAKR